MIKVLVIDDEPMQRQGIVRLTPWGDFGAEVVGAAGSGMEGILLAREHRPDVLIVDIKMPGLSGLDVIARLREELDAEYIILSGYGEFEFAQQAISLGVCAYLLKPLDDEELAAAVRLAAEHIEERRFHLHDAGSAEGGLCPSQSAGGGADSRLSAAGCAPYRGAYGGADYRARGCGRTWAQCELSAQALCTLRHLVQLLSDGLPSAPRGADAP